MASINYPLENVETRDSQHTWWHILYRWIATTDHKKLGLMYIICMLLFFVVSGLMAVAIRIQLAVPNNHFVSPETFNQLFTMHGTTMVFLVGMPLVAGLRKLFGAAYDRRSRYGFSPLECFWLLGFSVRWCAALLQLHCRLPAPVPPMLVGSVTPRSLHGLFPRASTDFWVLGVLVAGFGTIASAINVVATTITCVARA